LGRGGMGRVYLARDPVLERDVALKLPRFTTQATDELMKRLFREARSAAGLLHPNLCVIHDVGIHDGLPYVAMQFIPRETLAEVIAREGALIPGRAVKSTRQIAAALEIVHRAGIVHRDIKPANIMFNDADEPILTDFGLAFSGSAPEVNEVDPVID